MGKILKQALELELGLIRRKDLRDVVEQLLIEADDLHAIGPSSSSGKFHPEHELGYGGLVRHTRCVCMILGQLMQAHGEFRAHTDNLDVVFSSGILHDQAKFMNSWPKINPHHPILMAENIRKKIKGEDEDLDELIGRIADAVESHMSEWGTFHFHKGVPLYPSQIQPGMDVQTMIARKPETVTDWLLVHADMIASARWIDIEFDSNNVATKFAAR